MQNNAPYVGPRPFEENESKVFFGRGMEVNELVSLVTAHPVVVLYAQSGAGKTSLVKAGLIPVLVNEEKFDVLPPMRVREQVTPNTNLNNIKNVYMFNALVGARHAKDGDLVSKAFVLESLAKMTLSDFLRERLVASGEVNEFSSTVVIFDQFEEIFTLYPEYWEQRQGFFEQVAEALRLDPLLRVLFSMREDFIAELDPYASCLPEKLRTRFRIERLNRRTGLAAITEPLQAVGETSGGVSFAPGADEELINNLLMVKVKTAEGTRTVKGKFIEPLQLQVVCQTLWNNLKRNDKLITHEHLVAFGDVDKALSIFYENAIAKTAEVCGVKESVLRGWCQDKLITPAGTRATVFHGSEETAGLKNNAVAELEKQSLLRIELRGGAQWYELTHDRFVEVIQQSNQKWLLDRPAAEQTLLRLEEKAREWGQDRDDSRLLDEVELLEAERWLTASEAAELEPSKDLLALVRESREAIEFRQQKEAAELRRIADQARAARRFRWLTIAMAGLAVLALIAFVFALRSARVAEAARADAEIARKDAVTKKQEAEIALTKAEDAQRGERTANVRADTVEELSRLITAALNHLNTGDVTAAENEYGILLKTYQEKTDKSGIADAYVGLGLVSVKKEDYTKAVGLYDKALAALGADSKFREKAGYILLRKADAFLISAEKQTQDRRALKTYDKAIEWYIAAKSKFSPGTPGHNEASDGHNRAFRQRTALDDKLQQSPTQY